MLFPVRAALVIGTIFYLSPVRQPFHLGGAPEGASTAAQAVASLPPAVRAEAARAGLEALAGQAGGLLRTTLDADPSQRPAPPSRDTLREVDRGAPWHGGAAAVGRAPGRS